MCLQKQSQDLSVCGQWGSPVGPLICFIPPSLNPSNFFLLRPSSQRCQVPPPLFQHVGGGRCWGLPDPPHDSVPHLSWAKIYQEAPLLWLLQLHLGCSLLLWSRLAKPMWICGGSIATSPSTHTFWEPFHHVESLLEWKLCGAEWGRGACISHANLISAAVIESCRNLLPLPGETEELVYY